MKKRKCDLCGKDLTHLNYIKIVKDGKIITCCPRGCKNENLNADGVNRMRLEFRKR